MDAKDVLHDPVLPDVPDTTTGVAPYCRACNVRIPWEVAAIAVGTGQAVVDIGGLQQAFHPATGVEGAEVVSCTHPGAPKPTRQVRVIECKDCEGRGGTEWMTDDLPQWYSCSSCGGSGLVGLITDDKDPTIQRVVAVGLSGLDSQDLDASQVVHAPARSEWEKRQTRTTWNNFLALREMTKPADLGGDDEPAS